MVGSGHAASYNVSETFVEEFFYKSHQTTIAAVSCQYTIYSFMDRVSAILNVQYDSNGGSVKVEYIHDISMK